MWSPCYIWIISECFSDKGLIYKALYKFICFLFLYMIKVPVPMFMLSCWVWETSICCCIELVDALHSLLLSVNADQDVRMHALPMVQFRSVCRQLRTGYSCCCTWWLNCRRYEWLPSANHSCLLASLPSNRQQWVFSCILHYALVFHLFSSDRQ